MEFKKRLLLYGFGFILGSIVVFFVWNKKGTTIDWGMDARVLKNIRSKTLLVTPTASLVLIGNQIDSTSLSNILKKADINFSKSNTKTEPCKTYWVNTSYNGKKLSLIIQNCDSIATIERVVNEEK